MKQVSFVDRQKPTFPTIYVNLDELKITDFSKNIRPEQPLIYHYLSISEVNEYSIPLTTMESFKKEKANQPYILSLKSLLAKDNRKTYKEVDVNIIDADKGVIGIKEILDGNMNEYLIQATPFTVTCLKENKIKYGPLIIINKSNGFVKLSSPFDDAIKKHYHLYKMDHSGKPAPYGWKLSMGALAKDSSFGDINSDGYIIDGNFLTRSIITNLEKNIEYLCRIPYRLDQYNSLTPREEEIRKGSIDNIDYIFTKDMVKMLRVFIGEMRITEIDKAYNKEINLLKDTITRLKIENEGYNKIILSLKQQSIATNQDTLKQLSQETIKLADDFRSALIMDELITLSNKTLQVADNLQKFSNILELAPNIQIEHSENVVGLLGTNTTSDL